MNWLLRRLLALWVRFRARPEDAATRLHERTNPICYVLETRSAADLAVLQNACVQLRLARPAKRLIAESKDLRSFFYLSRSRCTGGGRRRRRAPGSDCCWWTTGPSPAEPASSCRCCSTGATRSSSSTSLFLCGPCSEKRPARKAAESLAPCALCMPRHAPHG